MRTLQLICAVMVMCVAMACVYGEEKMEEMEFLVPPSFFEAINREKSGPELKQSSVAEIFGFPLRTRDVSEWFKSVGVEFPEGSKAIYFEHRSRLVCRNTKANLELLSSLLESGCVLSPIFVMSEIFLVSFKVSSQVSDQELTYKKLRELAGESWKLRGVASSVSRSGARYVAEFRESGDSEAHARFEGEPVVGPDGVRIDLKYTYLFQGWKTADRTTEIQAEGNVSSSSGEFKLLKVVASPRQGEWSHAVVVRSTIQLPGNAALTGAQ